VTVPDAERQPKSLWRVSVEAPDADTAQAVIAALDGQGGAVSAFASAPEGSWHIDALSLDAPDRGLIAARLALAWSGLKGPPPEPAFARMAQRDWLKANQASFPPIAAGRFLIHGSHFKGPFPAGVVALEIDAATAFGTGEHGSTQGCLLALDLLVRRLRAPRRILDLGTGTGVLALAASRLWRRPVSAFDIDPEAVRVARRNARVNGVAGLVRARRAAGYRRRELWRRAPYDLVLANILARPLAKMARDLARALSPCGVAVLAGLLPRQEAFVLSAHRLAGLHLVARLEVSGWRSLVLARAPLRSFNRPINLNGGHP
jgi:ribosomal protein L11 methyltransferase